MPTGVVKAEFHNQGNVSQSRIRQVESLGPMEVIAHWTFFNQNYLNLYNSQIFTSQLSSYIFPISTYI